MDVVLEVCDTLLFDRLYASLLPINPAVTTFDPISTLTASQKGYNVNQTFGQDASYSEGGPVRSGWEWQPASSYFNVAPSEYAYMSRWDRDNVFRQFTSLYILTW